MSIDQRFKPALKAAFIHLFGSLTVALICAYVVLFLWYPYPYGELSGGRTLFLILVGVDVVCGPLLTLVLFNPKKSNRELLLDMSLVVFLQIAALAYGLHTAYQARPLFLVFEVDRFRVVGLPDYQGVDVQEKLEALPAELRPRAFGGPVLVTFKRPDSPEARRDILFESAFGGLDYSARPEFYVKFDEAARKAVIQRSKPLISFISQNPAVRNDAIHQLENAGLTLEMARFLPVQHKEDWIGLLGPDGDIVGFLPGDGFLIGQ